MASIPALIVGNGTVVTFGSDCRLLPGTRVLVEHGMITDIAPTPALRAAYPYASFIDAHGQYIMPGMICAHTHVYGAFARGMALKDAPPQSFGQILERLWWKLDRALQPDDIYYSALVCLVDAVRHGTTTLIDHHASPNSCDGSLDLIAHAFRQAGVRGSLCYEVSDREGKEKAREAIAENERFIRLVRSTPQAPPQPSPRAEEAPSLPTSALLARGEGAAGPSAGAEGTPSTPSPRAERAGVGSINTMTNPPLLSTLMGLHAALTLSDETMAEAAGVAQSLGVGCHIHVAEGPEDESDSIEHHGRHVVQRLHDLGILGPRTIAAHCIHIDEQERQLLAQTGTLVAHNPRSNMNNAVGTADVPAMLESGITVGLGNDGFSNDMFTEMKAAYLVHKAARGDPQAMPADAVLRLAVANNARIAGVTFGSAQQPVRFGELAVGAPADIILVNYKAPTPLTPANLPWHLIFGVDGSLVTTTIVGGRLLMRDGALQTLDEEAITARACELAAALWDRI